MEALIYGYLRDDLAEGHGAEIEEQLRALAHARGFCFAATFHEPSAEDGTALVELTQELKRADAHHVVVPSLDHFAGHVIPRDILLEKLTRDAAVRVWAPDSFGVLEPAYRAEQRRRRDSGDERQFRRCAQSP